MAHPKRVRHCQEGKPPQAVRQAFGRFGTEAGVGEGGTQ